MTVTTIPGPRAGSARIASLPDWAHRLLWAVLGLLAVGLVLAVKRTADHDGETFLFLYTVAVTTFQVSRVGAATLFDRAGRAVVARAPDAAGYRPTVSFVVPCMNEEAAIASTVRKCFEAGRHYPAHLIEVIVVDDGSTDGTYDVLCRLQADEFPELVVVHWEHNRGKRHGMAEGIRRATGEIVVQLDSDSFIEPRTFPELIKPFANPEIGAVCAHADPLNADRNLLTKLQAAYYFLSFRILKAAESTFYTVFCCSGCSSAYRRSVVLPVLDAWLDERFLGKPVTWGDDRALTNWVLRCGYRTLYSDTARAYTICPETLRQLLKQQVRWKKGWFVNSMFASSFVLRRHTFVALTYFFPLILLTLLTPVMATRALVWMPLVQHTVPLYYVVGVVSVAFVITAYYRFVARENTYWRYLLLWSGLNMIVLSFVLFYALATIQNRKWGTR